MRQKLSVKLFCLSVTILLIGVSYSLAISSGEKTSILKCQKHEINNSHVLSDIHHNRLERMVYRLELYRKILNFFSIYDPVFQVKYEKLFNGISTLKDIDDNSPICDVLENIYLFAKDIVYYIRDIYLGYQQDEPLKAFVINILGIPFAETWLMIWVIGYELNCWNDPF